MTAEKDVQVARKKGRGGEVIWAMPERKHSFLHEVFPYMHCMMGETNLILGPRSIFCTCYDGPLLPKYITKRPFSAPFKSVLYLS